MSNTIRFGARRPAFASVATTCALRRRRQFSVRIGAADAARGVEDPEPRQRSAHERPTHEPLNAPEPDRQNEDADIASASRRGPCPARGPRAVRRRACAGVLTAWRTGSADVTSKSLWIVQHLAVFPSWTRPWTRPARVAPRRTLQRGRRALTGRKSDAAQHATCATRRHAGKPVVLVNPTDIL